MDDLLTTLNTLHEEQLQALLSHHNTVNVNFLHQPLAIGGKDSASIKNPYLLRGGASDDLAQLLPETLAHFFCLRLAHHPFHFLMWA